jgi:hypothetical protein
MANRKKSTRADQKTPTAARLADTGIATGADFSRVMAALLADTIAGRIEPQRANASCNVAGKLIRMVELQHKYGRQVEGSTERMLALTPLAGTAASESIQ